MDFSTLQQLVQDHGLWLLAPVTVIEGPIVTVIAAYMASLGLLNVYAVYVICVLGDLVGDAIIYSIGRFGPKSLPGRWQVRLGLNRTRRQGLRTHFNETGGRTLIIGKLTHSAGAAVLFAAGTGKMPIGQFLWYNLLGTLPKTLLFVVLGYVFGYAYSTIDHYIFRASMILLVVALVGFGIWYYWGPTKSQEDAK
ncbi:hypothetical protein BVC71_10465 [Marivivens niveibacter]|uniref:VTT domain-containing protein n=1 Tax=Marivivens niveibacter TaxID=1930667 RepID=A0A251WXV7_9RHOB|nr:DedA family protein [Marivivens niveibacter]OUD09121.1 hypothetical protein BVC71_10465 [Marivivens niveibacter]